MKMILVAYNVSIEAELIEELPKMGVHCFTQWPRVYGRGNATGARFDNAVWPGANGMLMAVVEDAAAPQVMAAIGHLRDTIARRDGLKAFQLNVEAVTGEL